MNDINWFPGHMKKTEKLIEDNLKLTDYLVEVVDARIPVSGRNPLLADISKGKPRLLLLNKEDLADRNQTGLWCEKFSHQYPLCMSVNSQSGRGIKEFLSALEDIKSDREEGMLSKKPLRLMVVGVPNSGKSSLINRLCGRRSTKIGDRPGVTRGKQWVNIKNDMQLLDMPGILWPKFEDYKTGLHLAFCGSIKYETMDLQTLGLRLIESLSVSHPDKLLTRYSIDSLGEDGLETMEKIAAKRGFIIRGGKIDYERTARTVLDEFRSGLLGAITLERCELCED